MVTGQAATPYTGETNTWVRRIATYQRRSPSTEALQKAAPAQRNWNCNGWIAGGLVWASLKLKHQVSTLREDLKLLWVLPPRALSGRSEENPTILPELGGVLGEVIEMWPRINLKWNWALEDSHPSPVLWNVCSTCFLCSQKLPQEGYSPEKEMQCWDYLDGMHNCTQLRHL